MEPRRRRFYRRPRRYRDPYVGDPYADPYAPEPYAVVEETVEETIVPADVPPVRPFRADSPWFWLALLGILALVIVLAVVLIDAANDDPSPTVTVGADAAAIDVPNVVGQNHVDAGRAVDSLGLVADTFPIASDVAAGFVTQQAPAPGTEVPRGQLVHLEVALGPTARPSRTIPDVTGPPALDARERARTAGFTVRTIYRDAPSPEEAGEVLLQEPAAGATAPELTQITLYVGR